jgi:hypothetical protein
MRTVILNIAFALIAAQATGMQAEAALAARLPTDAEIVAQFETHVQRYVALHRRLEGTFHTVTVEKDWPTIKAAIEALAVKIRTARRDARRGDIFTPDVEAWFRKQVAGCLEGCDTEELLQRLNEENPKGLVLVPRINGEWPEEASLGPMPVALLARLPQLPDELQYRFMNRDLILWDAHANIVVDFIESAMP